MNRNVKGIARLLFLGSAVATTGTSRVQAVDCTQFLLQCEVIPENNPGDGFAFAVNCSQGVSCSQVVNPCLNQACGAGSSWECTDEGATSAGGWCQAPS